MRKFLVNVNGTKYELEVEEIDAKAVPTATPAAPAAAPAAPVKPAVTQAAAPAGGTTVTAPMPGNILSVAVKVGDKVKAGQILLMLEAMKMENEILSPCDGTVTGVNVAKGASVETGTLLATIG